MVIAVLRLYSYLVHLALALFLAGVSLVSMLGVPHTFQTSLLPWEGSLLRQAVFWSSLCGLASLALAVAGRFRYFFALWATTALAVFFRGFFLTNHAFADAADFANAVYFTLALLVAAIAAWLPPGKR